MRTNFSGLWDAAADAAAGAGGGASAATQAGATGASTAAVGAGTGAGAAAAAQPGPWHTEFFRPDGGINRDTFARMPEAYRGLGDGELKNVHTADDFLKKYHNLSTLAGKKALAPLPADATAEVIAERNALLRAVNGVPEKPDGYGLTRPDDFPEAAWNTEAATEAAAIMHKHNIPPGAAKELVASQMRHAQAGMKAQADFETKWFAEQDNAFREAMTKENVAVDKGTELAIRTARTFGVDPDAPIFKNAAVRAMLYKVGVAVGEPRLVTGSNGTGAGGKTPGQLAQDIVHNTKSEKYDAYWKPGHAQNKAVRQEVAALWTEQSRLDELAVAQGAKR